MPPVQESSLEGMGMDLHHFRNLVSMSRPSDWEVVRSGATYLPWITQVSSGGATWLEHEEPYHVATWAADIDIRIAWGVTSDRGLKFQGWDWPDPTINRVAIDGLFRGALVWRWSAYLVDGGRCYLPEHRSATVRTGSGLRDFEVFGYTSTPEDIGIARLINQLPDDHGNEFDRYLRESGIVEVPDSE